MKEEKLKKALADLEHALSFEKKAIKDGFYYLGIAKAFEIAFEYAWKYFRNESTEAGFEVVSPRDAIKYAGSLKLIDDVELWLTFLKARNVAVHDYLGLTPDEYLTMVKRFAAAAAKLKL
jgi:nucleotidyltransferase substrate binding protein (TIGR01987 family)